MDARGFGGQHAYGMVTSHKPAWQTCLWITEIMDGMHFGKCGTPQPLAGAGLSWILKSSLSHLLLGGSLPCFPLPISKRERGGEKQTH